MKIDHKKLLKEFYKPSAKTVGVFDVPALQFLMIDGKGDPNQSPDYAQAVQTLYQLSYPLKFMAKKGELATDYTVMPLEGLWWADDIEVFTQDYADKSQWQWTMMIMQPDFITSSMVEEAKSVAA